MIFATFLIPYIQISMSAKRIVGILKAQSIIIARRIGAQFHCILVVGSIAIPVSLAKRDAAWLLDKHVVCLHCSVNHNFLYLFKQLFLARRECELGILAIANRTVGAVDIKVRVSNTSVEGSFNTILKIVSIFSCAKTATVCNSNIAIITICLIRYIFYRISISNIIYTLL